MSYSYSASAIIFPLPTMIPSQAANPVMYLIICCLPFVWYPTTTSSQMTDCAIIFLQYTKLALDFNRNLSQRFFILTNIE